MRFTLFVHEKHKPKKNASIVQFHLVYAKKKKKTDNMCEFLRFVYTSVRIHVKFVACNCHLSFYHVLYFKMFVNVYTVYTVY